MKEETNNSQIEKKKKIVEGGSINLKTTYEPISVAEGFILLRASMHQLNLKPRALIPREEVYYDFKTSRGRLARVMF